MRRILAFGLGMTVIFGITTGVEAKTTDIVRVIPSNTDSRTRQMSPIEIPLTYGYGVNMEVRLFFQRLNNRKL